MVSNVDGVKGTVRDSNMELLRIVAMLFITFHHFITHALFPEILDISIPLNLGGKISAIFNRFTFIGVNCFILISGYYGIRFKVWSFGKLYLQCVFYGLLGYVFYILWHEQSWSYLIIYKTLFVFSHSPWWFITCYVALYLLSPILNKSRDLLDKKEYLVAILLLTFVNIYFGCYWHTMETHYGYSIMHFIYMYFIGGYIKRFGNVDALRNHRIWLIIVYILSACIWGLMLIIGHSSVHIFHWTPFAYNDIFNIIASLSFFLFFTTINISNRVINFVAISALSVYLLTTVCEEWLYPFVKYVGNCIVNNSDLLMVIVEFVVVALISVVVYAVCLVINQFQIIITSSILRGLEFVWVRLKKLLSRLF